MDINTEKGQCACACGCECSAEEQETYAKIANVIDLYKGKEGCLIQVLHAAQNIYGYLPLELQEFIAEGLRIPLSEVYGVVTFYSFFSTKERGKHSLRVCLGTACYVRGGKKLVDGLEKMLGVPVGDTTPDKIFSFEIARCIGACGLAPAMMIDDTVFKQVSPAKLRSILAKYYEEEGGAE